MEKLLKPMLVAGVMIALIVGIVSLVGWQRIYGLVGEPAADVSAPKTNSDAQLVFQYPSNWEVTTERSEVESIQIRTHSVESMGSALVLVQTFQPQTDVPLEDYIGSFLESFDEELASGWKGVVKNKGIEQREVKLTLLGEEHAGRELKLMLSALQQKVPFTIEIVMAHSEALTVVVVSMVPDDGLAAAQPGVELVRSSIKVAGSP